VTSILAAEGPVNHRVIDGWWIPVQPHDAIQAARSVFANGVAHGLGKLNLTEVRELYRSARAG